MIKVFDPSWQHILQPEFEAAYFKELESKIDHARKDTIIYPDEENVFEAFKLTTLDQLKVVLIGQDPYHGPNQAHGLAFSVQHGQKIPPSLRNIYTELYHDEGIWPKTDGNLNHWATQGILLINTALTVTAHKAGSHSKWGWHEFTKNILQRIVHEKEQLIFLVWGNHAQKIIDGLTGLDKHLIIKSAHPSPLSAHNGFWNSKPFSQINKFLADNNKTKINW